MKKISFYNLKYFSNISESSSKVFVALNLYSLLAEKMGILRFFNKIKVGINLILYSVFTLSLSSRQSTFPKAIFPSYLFDNYSKIRAISLQGLHQSAYKSRTTFSLFAMNPSTSSKISFATLQLVSTLSTIGESILSVI